MVIGKSNKGNSLMQMSARQKERYELSNLDKLIIKMQKNHDKKVKKSKENMIKMPMSDWIEYNSRVAKLDANTLSISDWEAAIRGILVDYKWDDFTFNQMLETSIRLYEHCKRKAKHD